jgi:hypothetical protein
VTLTAGKSTQFYTDTHVHDPAKVTVTRLLTWTDPNACYGATCKKTITGYRTVTNVVTFLDRRWATLCIKQLQLH